MDWKSQARDRFSFSKDADKWSDIYSSEQPNAEAVAFRQRRDFTVNSVLERTSSGQHVLDLGCGAGPVLKLLVNHGYKLTGIDYSEDMLIQARNNLGEQARDVYFKQGDCEQIPLPDNSVDCIVCLGVISYAESIENAIAEQVRVLKPGGICILSYRNVLNESLLDPIYGVRKLWLKANNRLPKKIGRSLSKEEVYQPISRQPVDIIDTFQTGFGNIRINGKVISDGRLAINWNRSLHRVLTALRLKALYRVLADVQVITFQKKT